MAPHTVEDISEILDTFNLVEIRDLLEKQVSINENDETSDRADYFTPLYYRYKQIMESEENPDDVKEEARKHFGDICRIFLSVLCNKFHLEIDEEWVIDNQEKLQGIVTAMYHFFVVDLTSNLQEVCLNYISKKKDELFQIFEERKNKKDAATLVNKKKYSIEGAVIIANIYDVSTWILSQLSESNYMAYMNSDYASLIVVKKLMEDGILGGDFMDVINEAYAESLNLKTEVCFHIISAYKENQV